MMTKEQLQNELNNYKRLYEVAREKFEKLEKERDDIEKYKEINLFLQVENKDFKDRVSELTRWNQSLLEENYIYKDVFKILKQGKENE